jgi:hypothetical protein
MSSDLHPLSCIVYYQLAAARRADATQTKQAQYRYDTQDTPESLYASPNRVQRIDISLEFPAEC